jgi:hypothetical protein
MAFDSAEHFFHIVGRGDIGLNGNRCTAERGDVVNHRLRLRSTRTVIDGYPEPTRGEDPCRGRTDSPAGAGDQRDSSCRRRFWLCHQWIRMTGRRRIPLRRETQREPAIDMSGLRRRWTGALPPSVRDTGVRATGGREGRGQRKIRYTRASRRSTALRCGCRDRSGTASAQCCPPSGAPQRPDHE